MLYCATERLGVSAESARKESVELDGVGYIGAQLPNELVVHRSLLDVEALRNDWYGTLAEYAEWSSPRPQTIPPFLMRSLRHQVSGRIGLSLVVAVLKQYSAVRKCALTAE